MSDTSYYAPLDEQSANSIRAKYRLLRSRRSKSDLHAANQVSYGEGDFEANCKANCKVNYEETEEASYVESYGTSFIRDYTITVHHLERNANYGRPAERCSGNRSEHRRRPSNSRPNKHRSSSNAAGVRLNHDHTFNAPTNLIYASAKLFACFATLLSGLLIVNCYFQFAWSHILVPVVNCLQAEYSSLFDSLAGKLTKTYKRSAAKLSTAFHLFGYLIPFACLVACFELYDLHFTFLKHFHGFLLLYMSTFVLPVSLGYLYLSRAPDRQRKRRLSSSRNSKEKISKSIAKPPHNYNNHRAALSRINKAISLSLLCLIDYALVRNGLRALHHARMQVLSIAYLVESFVDNLVNYDQPMFNHLPEEEHLPADRLSVLSFLTIFSLLRLAHSLTRLWFMRDHHVLSQPIRAKSDDSNRSEQERSRKHSNKYRQENNYRSKLRSYQKETTGRTESDVRKGRKNKVQTENHFEGMFEFSFTSVQPILLGSPSYASLFVAKPSCHTLVACLTLALLTACLLIILLIDLNRVDLLFPSIEKLSSSLLRISFRAGKQFSLNRAPKLMQRFRPVQLLNHLVMQNLCDLVFSSCLLVLIGHSTLLSFTLIGQLSFIYLNFKRKLSAP